MLCGSKLQCQIILQDMYEQLKLLLQKLTYIVEAISKQPPLFCIHIQP